MSYLTTFVLIGTTVLAQCPAADELCSKCNNTTCVACINSYPDIFGKCIEVPSNKVSNCYHYYQSGKCLVCASGYLRNTDFECDQIPIANCSIADAYGKCTSCKNSWRVANNTCSETFKCTRPNCARCFENDSCYECGPGYFLDYQGNCVANNDKIQDCRNTDVNGNCVICKENYYDKNGMCFSAKNATIFRVVSALMIFVSAFVA